MWLFNGDREGQIPRSTVYQDLASSMGSLPRKSTQVTVRLWEMKWEWCGTEDGPTEGCLSQIRKLGPHFKNVISKKELGKE